MHFKSQLKEAKFNFTPHCVGSVFARRPIKRGAETGIPIKYEYQFQFTNSQGNK